MNAGPWRRSVRAARFTIVMDAMGVVPAIAIGFPAASAYRCALSISIVEDRLESLVS